MARNETTVWALVVAATFFWGSNFNAGHAIASQLPPLTAAGERFGIAVLLLLLMRAWRRRPESQLSPTTMLHLGLLGLLGVFGFNYAFFTALQTTSALNAALIMSLSPLLTALLSSWLLRTPLPLRQLAGIGIAFAGVTLVITGGHLSAVHVAIGDLWMLTACLTWSLYSVLLKRHAAHVPASQQARWSISAGALALIAIALWRDDSVTLISTQSPQAWSILLYMALCGTVLAYIFWLHGVHALGPHRAAIAFNLVPVFTLLINLAMGTWPHPEQFAGLVLVLGGVLVASGWTPRMPGARKQGMTTAVRCGEPG
ncbi:DMT family transporter [Sinimarinibacterium sp. CAU 1509]|uniref:DMT family transporter n=1 Tax=Sinimarinibacterium sp. CAU 1509 TaxID=2562283 RepID=UPI0010AC7CC6|nr:DMT family transporter [Sinimarinibacterium sp. CAU 1509]TJY63302.1 DMT family transporter [Sinimarinibacterium sp. CAU 1509]